MAIFKNAYFTIQETGSTAATNLSSYLRSVDFQYGAEEQDDTVMGDDTRSNAPGTLLTWGFSLNIAQNSSAVDSVLFGAVGNTAAVVFRPSTAAVGPGNPQFTGTGFCGSYSPYTGSVGDFLEVPFNISNAGTLTRATA